MQVEQIVKNLQRQNITQIWRQSEILYSAKERIIDLLDYMNVIFFEELCEDKNAKYTKAVFTVEQTKKKILANANYDMSIDNLLLKLWEEFN